MKMQIKFYVCPLCGNVIQSTGEAAIGCCGNTLPALEAKSADPDHVCEITQAEDEYYVTVRHEMSKTHAISFLAAVRDDGFELKKLYPEWSAEARFKIAGTKQIYYYCNRHGLFSVPVKRARGTR